jgi:hypothetical protein
MCASIRCHGTGKTKASLGCVETLLLCNPMGGSGTDHNVWYGWQPERLAGQPLFVAKNQLKKLMKLKAGSPAARRQLAEQVIKHFLGEHKNQVMPKAQFRTEMRNSFPGAPNAPIAGETHRRRR